MSITRWLLIPLRGGRTIKALSFPRLDGPILVPTDATAPRAALYLRISTQDGRQTEENQRRELKALLDREGYALAGEFVDHESGRKGRRERAGFNEMFEAADEMRDA